MSHVLSVREGDLIGEYRLVRLLGAGGMGAVFEAVHETIGKRAAIKFLSLDAKRHPEFERRFIDEARAASEIQHAGVVNIFGFGRHTDGTMWMLMELLPGETLYSRLLAMQQSPARRMDRPVALTIARQLASVLVATHARGIVHRDLKPGNVMLVPDPESTIGERVKLMDFGIAKLMTESLRGPGPHGAALHKTATGAMMGTPNYMAPEQCLSAGQVDDRADVYALGAMLYELLAGCLPFNDSHPLVVMATKNDQPAPPIKGHDPDLPDEAATLVMAMLEREPARRPAMSDVYLALCRIQGIEPSKHSGYHHVVAANPNAELQPTKAGPAKDMPTLDAPIDSVAPPAAFPPRITEDLGVRAAAAPPQPSIRPAAVPKPPSPLRWRWFVAPLAVLCAVVIGIALGPWRPAKSRTGGHSPSPLAGPVAAPARLTDLALPDQAVPEPSLQPTFDMTFGDAYQSPVPVDGPSRAEPRPPCSLPTLRCILAVDLPSEHAGFILEALRRADVRLCAQQVLRITYRANTYGQQLLDMNPSAPSILSPAKKVRFLHVLDGKLPPGQRLRTPVVIKCPES